METLGRAAAAKKTVKKHQANPAPRARMREATPQHPPLIILILSLILILILLVLVVPPSALIRSTPFSGSFAHSGHVVKSPFTGVFVIQPLR